ncbi:hypothetical protein [uncultured Dialister sp.]|nr:hypothetical protein [uncultured Dialister sp.]
MAENRPGIHLSFAEAVGRWMPGHGPIGGEEAVIIVPSAVATI